MRTLLAAFIALLFAAPAAAQYVPFQAFTQPNSSSWLLGIPNNTIDRASSLNILVAPGDATRPNHIGKVSCLPVDAGSIAHGWTADDGYVSGEAIVASLFGGYDQCNNAIGSVIVHSNHSMISYGTTGHNLIIGNSFNWIDGNGGRSSIVGARASRVTGTGTYQFLGGGNENVINSTGSYNTISNGTGNTISGAAANSTITGGSDHTISAGQGAILGGATNTVTSVGSAIIGGDTNSTSGAYSVILGGTDNDDDGKRSVVLMGEDSVAIGPSSVYISRGLLAETGDAQAFTAVIGARTTNATITNMTGAGSNLDFDDTKVSAGTGTLYIVGLLDGSADANNDSVYTQVAYELEFGFYWDGTNGFLFTTGTETAVTAAPTLNSVLISQTNNDFTAGAAPKIALSTGAFRIQVTGVAATIINWVGRLDIVMTRVS